MNRAYLRPPLPLYRVAAVASLPLVMWGALHVSLSRLSPLQNLYWGDYLQTTFVPSLKLPTFGPTTQPKQEFQVLLCVGPKGAEVPLTKELEAAAGQPDAHLAAVPMTSTSSN